MMPGRWVAQGLRAQRASVVPLLLSGSDSTLQGSEWFRSEVCKCQGGGVIPRVVV